MKKLPHFALYGFYILLFALCVAPIGMAFDLQERNVLWLILGVVTVMASIIARGVDTMEERLCELKSILEDIRDQTNRK